MSAIVFAKSPGIPVTPPSGTTASFVDTTTISRFKYVDDAGGIVIVGPVPTVSVVTNTLYGASNIYLAGSGIVVNAGAWKAQTIYRCIFTGTKTGDASNVVINIRLGNTGTTSDASVCSFTFAAGTTVTDTGRFEVVATFRTVGSGTSAVVQGWAGCSHAFASTGFTATGNAGYGLILTTSSGFDSTTQTHIGISAAWGATPAVTVRQVQARLMGI